MNVFLRGISSATVSSALQCVVCVVLIGTSFAKADSGLPWGANARPSTEMPREIQDVGITEHLGKTVDTDLAFKDETGKTVTLKTYLDQGKPVIVSPVYYACPNLCNLHLNGMFDAMKRLDWNAGDKYTLVAFSIDPKEGPDVAAKKRETYLNLYGRPSANSGVHFLTAAPDVIQKFTSELGFKYHWDDVTKQWAHTSGAMILTPTGMISRYLYGIMFDPKILRLSLVEASNGHIGELLDRVVLFCFHYDPNRKGYAFYAYNLMRLGGAVTVLVLAAVLIPYWRRQKGQRTVKEQTS